jgi:hypothetical protein
VTVVEVTCSVAIWTTSLGRLEMKSCLAGGMVLSLKTDSWGHEYSRRASVTVPSSQLGSDHRSGRKVAEE